MSCGEHGTGNRRTPPYAPLYRGDFHASRYSNPLDLIWRDKDSPSDVHLQENSEWEHVPQHSPLG
jgi:hypothetical protein